MTTRGSQALTWDVENKPTTIGTSTFLYDGDGARVKKLVLSEAEGTENGQTVLYLNKYYEKNLNTGVVTTNYYLGSKLVAIKQGDTLRYVHQDSLTGTSVMSTSGGVLDSKISYFPYGLTRTGSVNTDKKFTGQRLDNTGLYYYGARYYDAGIGRYYRYEALRSRNSKTCNRNHLCLESYLL